MTRHSYGAGVLCLICSMGFVLSVSETAGASDEPSQAGLAAQNKASAAIQWFYYAYGHWPVNWQEVEHSGLLQTELKLPGGETVDPGDGSLDFPGDFVFGGYDGSNNAWLVSKLESDRPVMRWDLGVPGTYEEIFGRVDSIQAGSGAEPLLPLLESEETVRLLAHCGLLDHCLMLYQMSQPGDTGLEAYLASPFAPINRGSLNGMTGQKYRFDGSPGDLLVDLAEDGSVLKFHPVLSDGTVLRYFSVF